MTQIYLDSAGKILPPPPLDSQPSKNLTNRICNLIDRSLKYYLARRSDSSLLDRHVKYYLHPYFIEHVDIDGLFSLFHPGNINTSIDGKPLLHWIAADGFNLEAVDRAIQLRADPNAKDSGGNTALTLAASNANHVMVKKLIQCCKEGKGDCNLQDSFGWDHKHRNTALHLLIGKGHRLVDSTGELLHFSCLELAKDLIDIQADVNIQNGKGNTPLHLACIRRDLDACRLLLENGARADILNGEKKIPADLLHNTYEESRKSLGDQVVVFSLNPEQFEAPEPVKEIEKLLKKIK